MFADPKNRLRAVGFEQFEPDQFAGSLGEGWLIQFQLLLDGLQPAKVLVLSRRLYEYWIPETNGRTVCPISANGKRSTVWEYRHAGGSCLTMGVIHPSRMYGKATEAWKPLVDAFLAM